MKNNRLQIFLSSLFGLFMMMTVASCASTGQSQAESAPSWVRDPYTRYNRQQYFAAVGIGNSRQTAEGNAFGNLIAIFGQSMEIEERLSTTYEQVMGSNAITAWSENVVIDSTVVTAARMNTLVGAEIGDVWHDGDYYAVAFLNKAQASRIYSNIIASNRVIIDNLVNMTDEEKFTLDGFARYQFAATIEDVNTIYTNLLSLIGTPVQAQRGGDDLRLEAATIARTIPVQVRVDNDMAGRIQSAFARALSGMGFRSGGNGSRYVLDVNVTTAEVEIANNPNRWTRITVNAGLTDSGSGTVIFPYTFNERHGHLTQAEADNRAYSAAERRINDEYARLLNDHLSLLMPGAL